MVPELDPVLVVLVLDTALVTLVPVLVLGVGVTGVGAE